MKTRRISVGVSLALAGLLLSGCSQQTQSAIEINSAKTTSITASADSKYVRIVALANGSAEVVSALGQKKFLLGRDIASTDKDLETIPIVTSTNKIKEIVVIKRDAKSSPPSSCSNERTNCGINMAVSAPPTSKLYKIFGIVFATL